MGDRVAVMRKGELQQVAPPRGALRPAGERVRRRLHRQPGDEHARGAGRAQRTARSRSSSATARLELDDETLAARSGLAAFEGRPVVLGIRPENLEDAALVDGDRPRLRGQAELREALGSEVLLHFTVAARQAVTEDVRELAEDVGDDRLLDQLTAEPPPKTRLVGRFDPKTRIHEGDTIEVAIDKHALHFFDPESGRAIV